jgi:SAM-dependent methyltransferase
VRTAGLSRQYAKFCDRRDFDDPAIRGAIRQVAPGREEEAELERKLWEYAMLALFLDDVGRLNESTEVLAIGAGHEAPMYWLANRVGRVLATDIYGHGEFGTADREAALSVLEEPSAHAPYAYRTDHLEVRSMDARALDLPDASFDVAYSLSSIEHFGSPTDIARSAREMGRVLRPGGHALVVTECFVARNPMNSPLVHFGIRLASLGRRACGATPRKRAFDVFSRRELVSRIVEPSKLRLMQPLDTTISPETWENVTRHTGYAQLHPATGRRWPHILLQGAIGAPYTSVCLVLEKPASS